MFDRIIDVISGFGESISPITVVHQTERGIVFRLGKFNREIGPGPHFKIPFVDTIETDAVNEQALNLKPQSLTTLDGREIVIGVIVIVRIKDVKKTLIKIDSFESVVVDRCYGAVGDAVQSTMFSDVLTQDFRKTLSRAIKNGCRGAGVQILSVKISDLTRARTIKLIND